MTAPGMSRTSSRRNNALINNQEDQMAVKAEVMNVTPEMAREWLALNKTNRSTRHVRIAAYANDMADGRWPFTGDPIRFAGSNGNKQLVDGQHRLLALIEAGVTLPFLVVTNLDASSMSVIDTGASRTPGDTLQLQGVENANRTAAIARVLISYEAGRLGDTTWYARNITRSKLSEFVLANAKALEDSQDIARRLRRRGFNATAAGAWHFLAARDDSTEDLLELYLEQLFTGVGLIEGDPALAVQHFVMRPLTQGGGSSGGPMYAHLAAYIRGWNAVLSDTRLKVIKQWTYGRPFPRINYNDGALNELIVEFEQ